jgi:hypothetical protein
MDLTACYAIDDPPLGQRFAGVCFAQAWHE